MGFTFFKRIFITKRKCLRILHCSILLPLWCIALVACSGGNTQSGGIDISVLAGNYVGTFSFTATAIARPEIVSSIEGNATAQVTDTNRLVLDLSNGASILASLSGGGAFSVDVAASDAIVDVVCVQGVLTVSGQFETSGVATATITSQDLVCDGLEVDLVGRIDLTRT